MTSCHSRLTILLYLYSSQRSSCTTAAFVRKSLLDFVPMNATNREDGPSASKYLHKCDEWFRSLYALWTRVGDWQWSSSARSASKWHEIAGFFSAKQILLESLLESYRASTRYAERQVQYEDCRTCTRLKRSSRVSLKSSPVMSVSQRPLQRKVLLKDRRKLMSCLLNRFEGCLLIQVYNFVDCFWKEKTGHNILHQGTLRSFSFVRPRIWKLDSLKTTISKAGQSCWHLHILWFLWTTWAGTLTVGKVLLLLEITIHVCESFDVKGMDLVQSLPFDVEI